MYQCTYACASYWRGFTHVQLAGVDLQVNVNWCSYVVNRGFVWKCILDPGLESTSSLSYVINELKGIPKHPAVSKMHLSGSIC